MSEAPENRPDSVPESALLPSSESPSLVGRPHPRRQRRKLVTAFVSVLFVAGLAAFVYLGMWQGDGPAQPQHQQTQRGGDNATTVSERDLARAIRMLGQEEHETRERAAQWLASLGEPAVPALIGALAHQDAPVRDAAVHILRAIGEPAVPALREHILRPQAEGRMLALRALAGMGTPAAKPLAKWVRTGHDGQPRLVAVLEALTQHGVSAPHGREPLLAPKAPHPKAEATAPRVALSAAILRVWGEHRDHRVLRLAEQALGELSVHTVLLAGEADPKAEPHARRYILDVRGRAAVPSLIALLETDTPRLEPEVLTHLLITLEAEAVGQLANILREPVTDGKAGSKVRRRAATALAHIGEASTAERGTVGDALAFALRDPAAEVRAIAFAALARWVAELPALAHTLATASWHWELEQPGFAEAQAALRTAFAKEWLAEPLAQGKPSVALVAALAGFVHGWETASASSETQARRLQALVQSIRKGASVEAARFYAACAVLLAASSPAELTKRLAATHDELGAQALESTLTAHWRAARIAALRLLEQVAGRGAQQEELGEEAAPAGVGTAQAALAAAVPALARALTSEPRQAPRKMRRRILALLATLGEGATEALPAVDALRLRPEPELRNAAQVAWTAIQAEASGTAEEGLATPAALWLDRLDPDADAFAEDAQLRARAAWHLQELAPEQLAALREQEAELTRLIAALADENEQVRQRVSVVLVRLGDTAVPALLAALAEPKAPAAIEGTLLALDAAGAAVRKFTGKAVVAATLDEERSVAPRLRELVDVIGLEPTSVLRLLEEANRASVDAPLVSLALRHAERAARTYWASQPAGEPADPPAWVAPLVEALATVLADEAAASEKRRTALAALQAWRTHAGTAIEALIAVALATETDASLARKAARILREWLRPGSTSRPAGLLGRLVQHAATAPNEVQRERARELLRSSSDLELTREWIDALAEESLREAAIHWLTEEAPQPPAHYGEWIHERFRTVREEAASPESEPDGNEADADLHKRRLVGYATALAALDVQAALADLREAQEALAEPHTPQQRTLNEALKAAINTLEAATE